MRSIKIFVLFVLILFLNVSTYAQLVINEFSASNYTTTYDNFNNNEDWIEIYNTSGAAVNISGYYLSDNINNPTKWTFPAGLSVPANGFMRVWASGRDMVSGTHIHTNFKITQTKPTPEYIVFSNPAGVILESYNLHNYISQNNHSWGRTTNGANTWSVFATPTPNASNSTTAYERYAAKVDFSSIGGFYNNNLSLTLTTTEPNAIIKYTTNGDVPLTTSTTYTAPINITATTIILAKVFSNNPQVLPSLYEFHTFFINVNHTVPVVSIAGTGVSNLLGGNSSLKPHGCVEYYENGQLQTKVTGEFNKHGNDSWAYAQRGIDFISRDQFGYGDALRYQIFDATQRKNFQRIMFKPAANDNHPFQNGGAHIRDAYVHTLAQRAQMELDVRSYEPCVLYMNGQYWGLYETREKADDHDYTEYNFDQGKYDLYYLKTWGGTWSEYGGAAAQNDWNDLRNYIQNNNMGIAANYNYVQDRLNFLSLIDYFIINTHTVCMDWLNWNTAWWRGTNPAGQQLKWRYVLWDMDAVFGHYTNYTGIPNTGPSADPCFGENLPNPGGQGHTTIMKKLIDESPEFKQLYLNRYIQLLNTTLHCDVMIDILDELILRIEPEMQGQINRWGGNYTTWQNNVQAIRNFILQRCITVNQGMVNCYSLTGPYNVVFNVNPAGGGFINLNNTQLPSYPATSTFFGGIQNNLEAVANTGYQFSHWEILHNNLTPNNNASAVNVTFTSSDTIIAHFTPVASPKSITLLVEPVNAGSITINSFTPALYPWSGNYTDNTAINLSAAPNATYNFSHWTLQNHTILPGTLNPAGSFNVSANDTIIAHFTLEPVVTTYTLTVSVNPVNAGTVLLNNSTAINFSHSETYSSPTQINLNAEAKNNYMFSHWEISNHVLMPDNLNTDVGFMLADDEHVVAHFNHEEVLVFLPGSISPNNDGLNDYLMVYGNSKLDYCEIYVYNRWGQLVFESKELDFAWNGTYKGEKCPMDAYSYIFIYSLEGSDQKHRYLGSVVLLH